MGTYSNKSLAGLCLIIGPIVATNYAIEFSIT